MEASTLIDPQVAEACTTVVPVVAHGPLEHGTFETIEDGKPVTRCRLYRNLECSEHQGTHEALKPYQEKGRFRIPFTVWIDPSGKQIFRRDGWRKPEEFLFDIRLGLEKVPGPRRTRAEYAALVKPLDEGLAALAAERWGEAAEKLDKARKTDVPQVKEPAEAGLKELQARGDAYWKAAKTAWGSKKEKEARPLLQMLSREFSLFECGRLAADLLKSGAQ